MGLSAERLLYARAAFVKMLGAASAFFLTFIIARLLTSESAGIFMFLHTVLSVLMVVFRFGLDSVILKELSLNGDRGRDLHLTAILFVLLASLVFSLIVFLNSNFIAVALWGKPELSEPLSVMVFALPFMTFYTLVGVGYQSLRLVEKYVFYQNLGVSTVFVVAVSVVFFSVNDFVSPTRAAFIYTASSIFIFLLSLIWFWKRPAHLTLDSVLLKKTFLSSRKLFVSEVMMQVVSWAGVIAGGIWLSSPDIAFLSVSQRTAMLVGFVLMVANMILPVQFAEAWKEKDVDKIEIMAKKSCRILFSIAAPLSILMILFSKNILSLFGAEYESARLIFCILLLGQGVSVSMGSAGFLLIMTDNEESYRNSTLISGVVAVLLVIVMTKSYGVVGAAFATAFGVVFNKFLLILSARKRLGFWPLL